MPTPSRHFKNEIQDMLDGRLDVIASAEVERHLEECDECRREYEALRWTKLTAAKHLGGPGMPAALRAKILASLREEAGLPEAEMSQTEMPNVVTPPASVWMTKLRPLLSIAAVLLALAIVGGAWFLRQPTIPVAVARDFLSLKARKLTLQIETADVKEMEAFFTRRGIAFNTRVFDLGMMKYQLVGGRVHSLGRQPSAAFSYRGADGQLLLCQMYRGKVTELPAGATRREAKGFTFHIYQSGGVTAVFWQEGTVVCVLASDIPREEVVQLAIAKAMPVAGS